MVYKIFSGKKFKFLAIASLLSSFLVLVPATSTLADGNSWEAIDDQINANRRAIAYGDGVFVAIGNQSPQIYRSEDTGLTWSAVPAEDAGGDNDQLYDVAYGNGIFITVGGNDDDRVLRSTDRGETWSGSTTGMGSDPQHIAYGNGLWVVVSEDGDSFVSSDDGVSWTEHTAALAPVDPYDLDYGDGLFIAIDIGPNSSVSISDDGEDWNNIELDPFCAGNDVGYGNGVWMASCEQAENQLRRSTDNGLTWSLIDLPASDDRPLEVAYANGVWIAAVYDGDNVAWRSVDDGQTWTPVASFDTQLWYGLANGNGVWVMVGIDTDTKVARSVEPTPSFDQNSPGVKGAVEDNDNFGSSLVSGDFDGDGCSDLAAGAPNEDIGSIGNAGLVQIFWCPDAENDDFSDDSSYHQGTSGWPGANEEDDWFGHSLAVGDFNNDGYDDLAIGSPTEDIGSTENAGMVTVAYGSESSGLSSHQTFHQGQASTPGSAEEGDYFGYSLAAGDFNNDGYDDLVVGVAGEDIGSIEDAGAISVIYGTAAKLSRVYQQFFSQNTPGIKGVSEEEDLFAWSLATGDVNNDNYDDIIVGVPGEDIGSLEDAGMVQVLRGSFFGVTASGDLEYHQNRPGFPGTAEEGDYFGWSVSAGDIGSDGKADIVIGVPNEDLGSIENAGLVQIVHSTGSIQQITQDTPGVAGRAEDRDRFGHKVLVVDHTNSGGEDLIVSAPTEDIGSINSVGAVHTFKSSGGVISTSGDKVYHPGSSRLGGTSAEYSVFGTAVTYLESSGYIYSNATNNASEDSSGDIWYFNP